MACLRSMNHENSAGFGADWVQTSNKLERAVAFAYFLLRPFGTVKLPPTKFKRTDVRKESSPGYSWSGSCPGLSISRSSLPSGVSNSGGGVTERQTNGSSKRDQNASKSWWTALNVRPGKASQERSKIISEIFSTRTYQRTRMEIHQAIEDIHLLGK